jgi:hypothetical protein
MAIPNGGFSNTLVMRGALIEYANVDVPLMLFFEFNPSTITRTRSVTIKTGEAPGTVGGYDFSNKAETVRAAQSVTVNAESFSVKILLDATDRMNAGDPVASVMGVQPEIDTVRSMVEPKSQGASGARTLAALGKGEERAFSRSQYASVLLFVWGIHVLPIFLTQVQIEIKELLPTLIPYRAEATLTMQVIESINPFYINEIKRQVASSGLSLTGNLPLFGNIINL